MNIFGILFGSLWDFMGSGKVSGGGYGGVSGGGIWRGSLEGVSRGGLYFQFRLV